MNKTIKQLADELGVSKTAIRKYMTPEFREKYTSTTETGAILVSDEGANQLKSLRKPRETTGNKVVETPETTVSSDVVAVLKDTIATLQEQLAVKDALIDKLTGDLEVERQHSRDQADKLAVLADQAQHLQAMQGQLAAPKRKILSLFGRRKEVKNEASGS